MASLKKIIELREEKRKLQILANKQQRIMEAKQSLKKEQMELRREVRRLKIKTSKKVLPTLVRITRKLRSSEISPERKEQLRRIRDKTKKGFKAFQKFADRFGGTENL